MPLGKSTFRPASTKPTGPRPINIDREITSPKNDLLGWNTQAKRLGQYLVFHVETPVIIGVQGDWGSGKSSFINLVENKIGEEQKLPDKNKVEDPARRLHHYVSTRESSSEEAQVYLLRFDSWAFAQSAYDADELFPVYISSVIESYLQAVGKKTGTGVAQRFALLGKAGLVTAAGVFGGEAAGDVAQAALSGIKPSQVVDQLSSFKRSFQDLVDLLLEPKNGKYTNRLIVVVDDLDRIASDTAVDITEKIKVFLDVRGVVFVLAADLGIIQQGLKKKFGDDAQKEGKNYLDKIVKIQYNVPHLEANDLRTVVLGYPTFTGAFGIANKPLNDLLNQNCFKLLSVFPSIGGNLRNSKRVLLNFEFNHYLISATHSLSKDDALRLLVVTILFQYDHELAGAFYHWLADASRKPGDQVADDVIQADEILQQMDISDELRKEPAVKQFFSVVLACKYPIRQWRATYSATTMAGEMEED